jgi:peptide/nickel transport system permease protein
MSTISYGVRRILQGLLVVWLVSVLSFFALKLSPGDCLTPLLQNPSTPRAVVDQLRARLNYDQPWHIQYAQWLGSALQGDLGVRCSGFSPVAPLIAERAGNTLLMSLVSLLTSWLVGIPLGIFCAVHQNKWSDRLIQLVSYGLQGFPSFILAILLLMFAQNSGWFPIGGLTSIDHAQLSWFGKVVDVGYHLILPSLALTIVGFAGLQRLMRGNLLEVLRQDYIRTARAKGLPEQRVIYVHALRNAVNPLVTLLGFEFASLLSGALLTEYFFSIPGLGRLMISAINEKDVNLVMAGLMIGTILLVIGNLLADIALKLVDPRIQLQDLD